jgi:Gpi18-like mannosyltransferase
LKKRWWIFAAAALILARFLLAPNIIGYEVDMNFFRDWSAKLAEGGLKNIYSSGIYVDYPPVYLFVLYLLGNISRAFGLKAFETGYVILMKSPALLADIGLALLAFYTTRKFSTQKSPYALFVILLCPAIAINSVFWGQVDSIFVLFLMISLIFVIQNKLPLASVFFTISVLTKPQALIFAPLLLFPFLAETTTAKGWKTIGISAASAFMVMFLLCLPFANTLNPFWIVEKIKSTMGAYKYLSLNAFNMYFIAGKNFIAEATALPALDLSASEAEKFWGAIKILVPVLVTAATGLIWWKSGFRQASVFNRAKIIFFSGFLIMFTVFMLTPEMHERYSFPALICLYFAFAASGNRLLIPLMCAISLTLFANCYWLLAYLKVGGGNWLALGNWINSHGQLFACINLFALAYGYIITPIIIKLRGITTTKESSI